MKPDDRRGFLKKLAKGAVYSAPVIHSLTAPLEVLGQGKSFSHKHQGAGAGLVAPTPASPDLGGQAPGAKPPPGDIPPP